MKIVRKILTVALLSVLGLVTLMAASIFIDGWIGTRRLDGITNASMASTGGPRCALTLRGQLATVRIPPSL